MSLCKTVFVEFGGEAIKSHITRVEATSRKMLTTWTSMSFLLSNLSAVARKPGHYI